MVSPYPSTNSLLIENPFIHHIQTTLFHEQSYQEFTDEQTYFFDPVLSIQNWRDDLGSFICYSPIIVFIACLLLSIDEVYRSKSNSTLLEVQELQSLRNMQNNILQTNCTYKLTS